MRRVSVCLIVETQFLSSKRPRLDPRSLLLWTKRKVDCGRLTPNARTPPLHLTSSTSVPLYRVFRDTYNLPSFGMRIRSFTLPMCPTFRSANRLRRFSRFARRVKGSNVRAWQRNSHAYVLTCMRARVRISALPVLFYHRYTLF